MIYEYSYPSFIWNAKKKQYYRLHSVARYWQHQNAEAIHRGFGGSKFTVAGWEIADLRGDGWSEGGEKWFPGWEKWVSKRLGLFETDVAVYYWPFPANTEEGKCGLGGERQSEIDDGHSSSRDCISSMTRQIFLI